MQLTILHDREESMDPFRLHGARLLVIATLSFLHLIFLSFCNAADARNPTSDPIVLQAHSSPISTLAFLPGGKRLLSSEANGSIFLWNLADKQSTVIVPEKTRVVSLSADGTKLVTCAGYSTAIKVWDLATSKEVRVINVPGRIEVMTAFLSANHQKLFTLDCNQNRQEAPRVRRWDVESVRQEKMWTITKLAPPHEPRGAWPFMSALDLLADGKKLVAGVNEDGNGIRLIDVQSAREQRFPASQVWLGVCLTATPDGRLLASWNRGTNSQPRIWEMATGTEICALKGRYSAYSALAWSPDERVIASGDQRTGLRDLFGEQTVFLWNAATGAVLARFEHLKADVAALAFATDGKSLAAGLSDGTILIWNVEQNTIDRAAKRPLGIKDLENCWTDLVSGNAGKAYQAIWAMTADPRVSVPFLKLRLKPAPIIGRTQMKKWMTDLDSEKFSLRQTASKELAMAWEQTEQPIRDALRNNPTLETRRRLERIANTVSGIPSPENLRTIRAIMALERIGSPEAQAILESLAQGAARSRVTDEANASARRLSLRAAKGP